MTRAMTIVALTCFLVVGAAVTSILGRDSVPAARLEMASPVVKIPASNKESKKDRLAVAALALAAAWPAGSARRCSLNCGTARQPDSVMLASLAAFNTTS